MEGDQLQSLSRIVLKCVQFIVLQVFLAAGPDDINSVRGSSFDQCPNPQNHGAGLFFTNVLGE